MTWIDTSQKVVSSVFLGPKGEVQACIDLFPSRIQWKQHPDNLMGLLAVAMLQATDTHSVYDGPKWSDYILMQAQAGFVHPVARVQENALIVHKGDPLMDACVWRLQGDHVIAPDQQTWTVERFCGWKGLFWFPTKGFNMGKPFPQKSIEEAIVGEMLRLPNLRGQIGLLNLCGFVAKTASLARPNRSWSKNPEQAARLAITSAYEHLIARGNRTYAPTKLSVDTRKLPKKAMLCTDMRDLVHIVVDCVLSSAVPMEFLAPADPKAPLSAHATLCVQKLVDRIQQVLPVLQETSETT